MQFHGRKGEASGNRKQACQRVVWTLLDGSQIGNTTVLSPSHVPSCHSSPAAPLSHANPSVRTLSTDTGVTQLTQTLTPRLAVQALFPPGHTELHTLTQAPTWSMPTERYPCECPHPYTQAPVSSEWHRGICGLPWQAPCPLSRLQPLQTSLWPRHLHSSEHVQCVHCGLQASPKSLPLLCLFP